MEVSRWWFLTKVVLIRCHEWWGLCKSLNQTGNEAVSIQWNSPRDRQRNKLLIKHQVVENVRSHQRSHPDELTGKWQKADEYLALKQPSASLGCSQNETVEWAINSLKCILLLCPKGSTAGQGELGGGEKQTPKIQPSLSHRNKSLYRNLQRTTVSWGRAFWRP